MLFEEDRRHLIRVRTKSAREAAVVYILNFKSFIKIVVH